MDLSFAINKYTSFAKWVKRETSFLPYLLHPFKYTTREEKPKIYKMYEIVLSHQGINFFSSAFCRSRVHPKNLFAWFVFPPNHRSDRAYLPFLSEKYRRKVFRLLFDVSHSSFRQIGAASFAKAHISERNDRRDKRRPQIYVSLESWDGEYLVYDVLRPLILLHRETEKQF